MIVNGYDYSNSLNVLQVSSFNKSQPGSMSVDATVAVPGVSDTDGSNKSNLKSDTSANDASRKKAEAEKAQNSKTNSTEETTLNFKLHKATGVTMIQIVDSSGKVIKEIPPEKILDSVAEIWKNAGINVDKSI